MPATSISGQHLSAHSTWLSLPGLTSISWERARPSSPAPIPTTNIAHVLGRPWTPKGRAETLRIEGFRNLGIAQVGGEGVDPCDGLCGSFQGPFTGLHALHLHARHHP